MRAMPPIDARASRYREPARTSPRRRADSAAGWRSHAASSCVVRSPSTSPPVRRCADDTCPPTARRLLSTQHTVSASMSTVDLYHRCKKTFFYVFVVVTFFHVFNVFLFSKRFILFLKNVGKVQSGKQINKKHFQNDSNEIDLWFFCCMSNDLKCLPINFCLLTVFDAMCDVAQYWRCHC